MTISKILSSICIVCQLLIFYPVFVFHEFGIDCYVRAYVYRDDNGLYVKRENDNCSVDLDYDDNEIVIYSKKHFVVIKIPDSIGHGFVSFWYRWGNLRAYFEGNPVDIKYGDIIRG